MSRKLLAALVSSLLMSGVAAAQTTATFPSSINETGPNYGAVGDARTYNPFARFGAGRGQVPGASSVDETHPAHTGGQAMPTMQGSRSAAGGTRPGSANVRSASGPSSVDESHPGHTGGQSMPSMGYGR